LSDNKLYWLPDAISIYLIETIECNDYYILNQSDVNELYEQMGLQQNMTLTYATLLKLSSVNNISYVLIGNVKNESDNLIINAFLYNSKNGDTFEIELNDKLQNIMLIQASLANKIISYLNSKGLKCSFNKDIFDQVSSYSFEMFCKGVQEIQAEKSIKFFKQAYKENNKFDAPKYYLAKIYYQAAEYDKAIELLKDISQSKSFYKKSLFLKANALAKLNNLSEALSAFLEVSKLHLSSSVFNNLAVVLMRQNNLNHASWYLHQALSILPDDPDIILNYSILNILNNNIYEAKKYLMNYINKNPKNFAAHFLMEYLAKKENNASISIVCSDLANEFGNYNAIKNKYDDKIVNLTKLEIDLDNELRFKFYAEKSAKNKENAEAALIGYKNRIRENIKRKEYAKSLENLSKAILLKPYDWELHYLKGLYYYSINDYVNSKKYLEFSLWCEPNQESSKLLSLINADTK
jgi:Flp pilus assembly protein TadD